MIQLVEPSAVKPLFEQYHPHRSLPRRHYYCMTYGTDVALCWDPLYWRPEFIELVAAVIRPGSRYKHSGVMSKAIGWLRSTRRYKVAFTYCPRVYGTGTTYRGCTWVEEGPCLCYMDGTFIRCERGYPLFWKAIKPQFSLWEKSGPMIAKTDEETIIDEAANQHREWVRRQWQHAVDDGVTAPWEADNQSNEAMRHFREGLYRRLRERGL